MLGHKFGEICNYEDYWFKHSLQRKNEENVKW